MDSSFRNEDIAHPELLEMLKEWRYNKAKELKRPAYTVLQQKAMLGIANMLPVTSEDLLKVPSLGQKTFDNYAIEIMSVIRAYRGKKE